MPNPATTWWPSPPERRLLGRFYMAAGLGELLNVVFPFQFAYFFLAMERPEWAVIPVLASAATVLAVEIPTGLVADRFGRKASVLAGHLATALSWAIVPTAVALEGPAQVWAASGCFAVSGFGQTFVSGAYESWVVDNLRHRERADLVESFFAREASFTAVGGVLAGVAAVAILLAADVDRQLLDLLWYLGAAGFVVAAAILATIPEQVAPDETGPEAALASDPGIVQRLWMFVRRPALVALTAAIAIATFSGSVADEAFDMSLLTKGMDARGLAPLTIGEDLVGVVAPVLGLWLVRRWGATRLLVGFLVVSALLALVFFLGPGWPTVFALYLAFAAIDRIWDPVAETKLHELIPSTWRATAVSLVNQLSGLAETAGFALLAVLLGEHSEALREATPNLVEAFRGNPATPADVPTGLFGLPIPDLAVVVFVGSGLFAIPFLLYAKRRHTEENR